MKLLTKNIVYDRVLNIDELTFGKRCSLVDNVRKALSKRRCAMERPIPMRRPVPKRIKIFIAIIIAMIIVILFAFKYYGGKKVLDVGFLRQELRSPEKQTRLDVIGYILERRNEAGYILLTEALADADRCNPKKEEKRCGECVVCKAKDGLCQAKAVLELIEALKTSEKEKRIEAACCLINLGRDSVDSVIGLLGTEDKMLEWYLQQILYEIRERGEVREALEKAVKDKNTRVSFAAYQILKKIQPLQEITEENEETLKAAGKEAAAKEASEKKAASEAAASAKS